MWRYCFIEILICQDIVRIQFIVTVSFTNLKYIVNCLKDKVDD